VPHDEGTWFTPNRPPTALEDIQKMRYEQGFNLLRQVDPANPLLSALDRSKSYPHSFDVFEIWEELGRLKKDAKEHPEAYGLEVQRMLSALDDHHLLAKEFADTYPRGIDPEEFRMWLDAGWHRLLHAYWNLQIQQFLREVPKASSQQVFEQLRNMMKQSKHLEPRQ